MTDALPYRSAEERLPGDAEGWFGRYPFERKPYGWQFSLPHNRKGVVAYIDPVNYRSGRDWLPIPFTMFRDRAGGYAYPHDPIRVLPGGFLSENGQSYGIRSMGVLQHGRQVPLWKAGTWGVEPLGLRQAIGPYEVFTSFESCGRKQEIILPEMPHVDGDALYVDYWVRGMPPPEVCSCRPFALDSQGREVVLSKARTDLGRIETIPLDVLASLAFPVVLDPETLGSAGWFAFGGSSVYAAARNSSSSWGTNQCARGPGQTYFSVPGTYQVNRHAVKWNCNAFDAGVIDSCFVRAACCSIADHSLPGWPGDLSIPHIWSQADFVTWDPPDLFTIENVYDLIRTSTHGSLLWTPQDTEDKGCFAAPNCIDVDWVPFTDASDVAFLNTMYAVAPPNRNLRGGISGQNDHLNTAPVGLEETFEGYRGVCGPKLKFEVGGGGWVWLIS